MSTVQYVAIGVAVLLVVVLMGALLVTRRRDSWEDEPVDEGFFLAQPPTDTLARLGEPERPMEDVTIDPAVEREARLRADIEATPAAAPATASPAVQATLHPMEGDPRAAAAEPERGTEGEPAASPSPAPGSGHRMVPLSSIIATTSGKMVDLGDPEVRRMLTDLVRLGVDQAATHSAEGRTLDAVLQLTEAEKVSRILDMEEPAERIHEMLEELRLRL